MAQSSFEVGSVVRHPKHGIGAVRADMGATAVVRFGHGVEECDKSLLNRLPSLVERSARSPWDVPLEVVNRIQAEAIISINDAWGVFARSRIDLLPHQLWVCREVNKDWPARWLVADDVGLGKTIEAGIILTALLSGGRVNRLLVMCPASLVEQWQQRLRTMFDIRLAVYTPGADTQRTDFWHTHSQVVVSMHTLRADHKGRHDRLLECEPWDLLLVDESHHLNADEKAGPTLAYELIKKLEDHNKINSMIFFTGTPHRGKTFGFLAQLHLLRPDRFDPRRPLREQLPQLRSTVIRNNKYNVTDLKGVRLFKEPSVDMATYSYSAEEQLFYDMLTEFILKGRAYAARLSQADASAVILVLIAMQKLASSSVAAIRRAIKGRLDRVHKGRRRVTELNERLERYRHLLDADGGDEIAKAEEELAKLSSSLRLMEDEETALKRLLEVADAVPGETKISRLLEIVEERFAHRSILFFTEYKATQSLLMSELISRFGNDCVTFINGDERADEVKMADGAMRSLSVPRDVAADDFNSGKVRFLVSTEAAGEGIDLQENCYTLAHVDLPWNPMRLHQRVGRLNRIGQHHRVEVISIRNPSTVEARIWSKLDEKLNRINEAFAHVMDTPEDLKQLVLGMTSSQFFGRLYSDAIEKPEEQLASWFDEQTATFGGEDAVQVVEALVGSVHQFDFQKVSPRLPQVDLPDLRPFVEAALMVNGRRVAATDEGISFNTPDSWRVSPAVRTKFERMIFDRQDRSTGAAQRLLGVGHKLVDIALAEAAGRDATVAVIPSTILEAPVIAVRIQDRVTDGPIKRPIVVGVVLHPDDSAPTVLPDWKLLTLVNELPWRKEVMKKAETAAAPERLAEAIQRSLEEVGSQLPQLAAGFRVPECIAVAALWPG
ncbi:MAG: DEAD/DEAH box helicase family protein [Phycisphaerae bacterium]|nr:DEAD/DEAH box helicase family protein [Phycisphaerae bacterium]